MYIFRRRIPVSRRLSSLPVLLGLPFEVFCGGASILLQTKGCEWPFFASNSDLAEFYL
jgi:hypothetical protein